MPVPNLIHPVTVKIQPIDPGTTVYDDEAREPVRTIRRKTEVSIDAQVRYRGISEPQWTLGGFAEEVKGYFLFREVDLTAKAYAPARGDRAVQVGPRVTSLFLLQTEDAALWPDQSGPTLRKAYFTDRRPSANKPVM